MLYAAYQCLKYHLDFQRSPGLGIKRICEAENQPILRSLQRKSTHKDSWKPISYRLIFRNPPKYLVMCGWHIHWILVRGWTDPVWKICASQFGSPFPHKHRGYKVQNILAKPLPIWRRRILTSPGNPHHCAVLGCHVVPSLGPRRRSKKKPVVEGRNPSILEKCMDYLFVLCVLFPCCISMRRGKMVKSLIKNCYTYL